MFFMNGYRGHITNNFQWGSVRFCWNAVSRQKPGHMRSGPDQIRSNQTRGSTEPTYKPGLSANWQKGWRGGPFYRLLEEGGRDEVRERERPIFLHYPKGTWKGMTRLCEWKCFIRAWQILDNKGVDVDGCCHSTQKEAMLVHTNQCWEKHLRNTVLMWCLK